MNSRYLFNLILSLCLFRPLAVIAEFSSGSTGADGALNVTTTTNIVMPPDGIFNFTTITVALGATVTFTKNALNTPVYMLSSGGVVINGSIYVSGSNSGSPNNPSGGVGGPGGFDGGQGTSQGFPNGEGQGPGGGIVPAAPNGVFGIPFSGSNSNIYGNTLLSPLIAGSGGSGGNGGVYGGFGGGGGGGAILIASSTRISVQGGVYSRGGNGGANITGFVGGGGSGGAIRLVAPAVDGTGDLDTLWGSGAGLVPPARGNGRVRIDTLDRLAWRALNLGNAGKWTVGIQMFVFPAGNPHLDIISAAGTPIPEGTNAPVIVTLPVGSSTNQIVRVQARGFTGDIPIRVKITPENAPSATFDDVITNTGNPSVGEVTVTLPLDTVTYIHAWTR